MVALKIHASNGMNIPMSPTNSRKSGYVPIKIHETTLIRNGNVGVTIIHHPPVITIDSWYVHHFQSWVAYHCYTYIIWLIIYWPENKAILGWFPLWKPMIPGLDRSEVVMEFTHLFRESRWVPHPVCFVGGTPGSQDGGGDTKPESEGFRVNGMIMASI